MRPSERSRFITRGAATNGMGAPDLMPDLMRVPT